MRFDVTPSLFYGSTAAAVIGLSLGLLLHGPWESHAGGPQLHLSSAAADELARPPSSDDQPLAEPDVQIAQNDQAVPDGVLDTAYLPPTPLPVTRLKPDMFVPAPAVAPAAADAPERQDADALVQDAGASQIADATN